MLLAHLKRILGLNRLRLRGPNDAKDEFLLAAIAQTLRNSRSCGLTAPTRSSRHDLSGQINAKRRRDGHLPELNQTATPEPEGSSKRVIRPTFSRKSALDAHDSDGLRADLHPDCRYSNAALRNRPFVVEEAIRGYFAAKAALTFQLLNQEMFG